MQFLEDLLINNGLSENLSWWLNFIFTSLILLTIAWLLRLITRRILIFLFNKFAKTTKFTFDDALVKHKFPKNLSRYIPYLFLSSVTGLWSNNSEIVLSWLSAIIDLYAVLISVYLIRSFLRAAREELQKKDQFKDKPIDSYIQVVLIFIWSLAILVSFSIVSGKELIYFFTGIGALSAVLLLVFRDTILGFVASIQIAANDLVRIGDWITMESYGADGDVVEINLSTIKVKNFDNTITTVPTYKLLSSSIKNWRGMSESDGRRIKRAIYLSASSIKFLNHEELTSIKKVERFKSFVESKIKEVDDHNKSQKSDTTIPLNGRNLTNIGLFRSYIETYLFTHAEINQNLTVMCRQLSPTPYGIPLEIYAFTIDKVWKNHERISADIFDHVLSSASYFQLRLFEYEQNAKKPS